MASLHWDLTKSATRSTLFDQTSKLLSPAKLASVDAATKAAGVPHVHHHNIGEVKRSIGSIDAPDAVKGHLLAIYDILAQAEATAHGCAVDQTHFHEVGEGKRIEATLRMCLAIAALNPTQITSTHVQTGEGTVTCAHGELEIPAPATAAIIARGIPVCEKKLPGELLTPTSAAIIYHYVDTFNS